MLSSSVFRASCYRLAGASGSYVELALISQEILALGRSGHEPS